MHEMNKPNIAIYIQYYLTVMFTLQAILDYWHSNLNHFLSISHHYFIPDTSYLTDIPESSPHIYVPISLTLFLLWPTSMLKLHQIIIHENLTILESRMFTCL